MAIEASSVAEPAPGTVLKLLIEAKNGDYAGAARIIGKSTQALSDRIAGRCQLKYGEIEKLARYFGVKPGVFFIPPMEFFQGLAEASGRYLDAAGQKPYLRPLPAPDLSRPAQMVLSFPPGLSPIPGHHHRTSPNVSCGSLGVGGGDAGNGCARPVAT